ncbi:MAG: ROK family protein [Burkholderiaceae bacterium]
MPGERSKRSPAIADARAASSSTFPAQAWRPTIAASPELDSPADPDRRVRRKPATPHATPRLQRYEARLARALAQVINILDPDVIVLGGGLSNIDRLYENVPRLWGAARLFRPRGNPAAQAPARRLLRRARRGVAMELIAPGHRQRHLYRPGRLAARRKPWQRDRQGSAVRPRAGSGPTGLAGDEHADPRAHGGPKRPCICSRLEHHEALARAFPRGPPPGCPAGSAKICRHGASPKTSPASATSSPSAAARLQIGQPRTPCWKIDARCGVEGVAAHVARTWHRRLVLPRAGGGRMQLPAMR